jgi:hypothetical protein
MSLQWMTAADVMSAPAPAPSPRAAGTHVVHNVPADPLVYDAFKSDPVLAAAIERSGASWAEASIAELGKLIGSSELQELALAANQHAPLLHTHDRFGRRLDRVEFHPAYHELMRLSYASKGPFVGVDRQSSGSAGSARRALVSLEPG